MGGAEAGQTLIRIVMRSALALFLLSSISLSGLEPSDAEARLRMARQIARERNDGELVSRVEKLARDFKLTLPADAEARLQEVEKAVGIDPGGWSMAGQPLFHPTPAMEAALKASGPKLKEAMATADADAVRNVVAETIRLLGDQAGVPDGRRPGTRLPSIQINARGATQLFLDALASEGSSIRRLSDGKPLPGQMLRLYAAVLDATTMMHSHVKVHLPERTGDLEKLARGVASILISLQQPEGHFPFPDLRGKNIRFGDLIQRQLDLGAVRVKDGWVITADPDGGSQFDTGGCGIALLRAGELHSEESWKSAGRRAANWAAEQKCCANFNYNAFSVSLLAHAARVTGDSKYHEQALSKLRLGVAPGQAPNGRWMDPHNARTVYHVIILRALADLGRSPEIDAIAQPAIRTLLDEFDAMGMTVEALPELLALSRLYPTDKRLSEAVRTMASSLVSQCTDGKRVKMDVQPHQLAAVADALAE